MIKFVYNPRFERPGFDRILYEPVPKEVLDYRFDYRSFAKLEIEELRKVRVPRPKMGPELEMLLFLKYNYARWLREGDAGRNGEKDYLDSVVSENESVLLNCHLPLVPAMIKLRYVAGDNTDDMMSVGSEAVLRCIYGFDLARGFAFSTYGCRSIISSFKKLRSKNGRYSRAFPASYDPEMEIAGIVGRDSIDLEVLRRIVDRNLAGLTIREMNVIRLQFYGLEKASAGDVGEFLGCSKKSVSWSAVLAYRKIRKAFPGVKAGMLKR